MESAAGLEFMHAMRPPFMHRTHPHTVEYAGSVGPTDSPALHAPYTPPHGGVSGVRRPQIVRWMEFIRDAPAIHAP